MSPMTPNLTPLCIQRNFERTFSRDKDMKKERMDKETDMKKSNTQTPRRTLGMGRMTPRTNKILAVKRSNQQDNNLETTPGDFNRSKQVNIDNSSLNTPKKYRRISIDNLDERKCSKNASSTFSEIQKNDCERLEAEITEMKIRLCKFEKFQTKKKELMQLIQLWSNGGNSALKVLQQEIQPEQDIEQIQKHLNIPIDIFDLTIEK